MATPPQGISNRDPRALSVLLAEDAWQGDAYAVVRVDGQVAFSGLVQPPHGSAGTRVDLGSFDPAAAQSITVEFTNDAWGGTSDTDRNLFVRDILVDGVSTGMSADLYAAGTATFEVPPAPAPLPVAINVGQGPDTIAFAIAEDAWQGDARFVVLLDGQPVGGEQQASALAANGESQQVVLRGDFSSAPHQVGIRFLNDAYDGAGKDRNLYVQSVSLNGHDLGLSQSLYCQGDATFDIGQAPREQAFGDGPDVLRLSVSEDAWNGNAVMTVSVDGVQAGPAIEVTATRAAGQAQDIVLRGNFGPGAHTVSVAFTNDTWGGTPDTDRNLFVHSISLNGTLLPGGQADMYLAGVHSVSAFIPAAPETVPAPPAGQPPQPSAPAAVSAGANADVGLVPVTAPSYPANARVLTVGADKQFQTIAAAIGASRDGDVVLVDAGTYVNDFAVVNTRISLLAVGGRVTMRADIPPPNYKGILTVETDLRVEGFTFAGAHIPDEYGHNAAGIRQEGGNLVLVNDSFTGNQDGILNGNAGVGPSSIVIDHCLFDGNGGNDGNGAGNIHNVYIGNLDSATVTNSIFENTLVGHEFKSRALVNILTNNAFISGVGTGTGSYDIDLPNGGKATLIGNTIIKGAGAENRNMVHFGGEGIPYAGSALTLEQNLFSTDIDGAVGVLNDTSVTIHVANNVLDGLPAAAFVRGPAKLSDNAFLSGEKLPDASLVGVLPGHTLILTDDLDHQVVVSGGEIEAVQGGTGHVTLDVAAGHVIVIGGAGGIDLTERQGTGGSQFATVAGSVNTIRLWGVGGNSIDSEGTDTIFAGDGNQSGQLNGNATVIGGQGSSTWVVNGAAALEMHGSNFLSLGATASLALTGATDFFKLDSNGGQASWNGIDSQGRALKGSISGGAATLQGYDGAIHMDTAGGTAGAVIRLDQGNALIRSLGADVIYAGSGDVTTVLSGASKVYAGDGRLSVFGRGNTVGADVYGRGGRILIDGDSGNITYHGGDQANAVDANLNNITLLGGNGLLTIYGGARDTVIGGQGGIAFHDIGGGANHIVTQAGSSNLLEISGSNDVSSWGQDTIIHNNGNTRIDVHGDSTLHIGTGVTDLSLAGKDDVTSVGGYCRVTLGAGADVTFDADTVADIHATQATLRASLAGSAGNPVSTPTAVTVSGGAFNLHMENGQGIQLSTDASAGPSSITASGTVRIDSAGADRIALGDGAATLRIYGDGADIQAGSGQLDLYADWSAKAFTLHGGSGAINLGLTATAMRFIGGAGDATLSGGRMDVVAGSGALHISGTYLASFNGGSGDADIALDNSGSLLSFGSGAATVRQADWGNANTYSFANADHGREIIQGFRAGFDIAKAGPGVTVAAQDTAGGSAHFILSNGADITFVGLNQTAGVFS